MQIDRARALKLLVDWARWAERWWYPIPGQPGVGCFGTGFNWWGVQTNQKYLAALAVLSAEPTLDEATRDWARQRAMQALRYSLASHHTGHLTCTDGHRWGRTWISVLGIERMMHGVHLLQRHFTDDDHAALRRVLEDESNWLLNDYFRGPHKDVQADKWGHSGKNDPESNLWNGAALWRTAAMYPDDPHADRWRERALRFLANGVSVAADASDDTIFDGKPLRDRHVGASFFDSFALDHHEYFNVGYMIICTSNAAILHFDLKQKSMPAPQLLHLHQADLWRTLRPMIFTDGRLIRIGGDTRVRYAYCQEYLLPTLLYAVDHLGETDITPLINGTLDFIEQEASHNGDGSFYGKRLASLEAMNPYYSVRLEGDRASGLSMLLAYAPLTRTPAPATPARETLWVDSEYGAALHRSEHRVASFAWRASGLSQGLCVPPDASDLAEWQQNLAGEIRFAHHDKHGHAAGGRILVRCETRGIAGGFVTSGTIIEGTRAELAEGWSGGDLGTHYIAFIALPDGRSVVGIQVARNSARRTIVAVVKGLRLNVPNDLFNGFCRSVQTQHGERTLHAATQDEVLSLDSRCATIDGKLSVIGLHGADSLVLDRTPRQRGGAVPNLNVDQLCLTHRPGPFMAESNQLLLDCSWIVSCTDSAGAKQLATSNAKAVIALENDALRAVRVRDAAGVTHLIVLNASESPQSADVLGRTTTLAAGAVAHWMGE